MALRFTHITLGQRVIMEAGAARRHLAEEVERLEAARPMIIAGGSAAPVADELATGFSGAVRWSEVVQHVPVQVAKRARAAAEDAGVDVLVCIGGGSATGLAKAVALTTRLPIIAVPTTYAGSEATSMWGLTEARHKTTGLDPAVLPVTVIYDAVLTVDLPAHLTVCSAFNALAHGVDSMWAPGADPINQLLALEGIRALTAALPQVVDEPTRLEGRDQCLYGAYLTAVAFASAGSGLQHKICHMLGGLYGLPHAETHAIVLPYVLAYNAPVVPDLSGRLADALGSPPGPDDDPAATAIATLERLRDRVDPPRALRDVGLPETGIPDAARRVVEAAPSSNPAPVSYELIEALLRAAWAGEPPARIS